MRISHLFVVSVSVVACKQVGSNADTSAALNAQGGNASVLHLPDAGLYGNSHFMFSDLNNVAVADRLMRFLEAKRLDVR